MKCQNNKKMLMLKGGLIGIAVCIVLFFVYLGIYFPLIDYLTNCEPSLSSYCQGPPAWTTTIPMITGHFFPVYSHFIIEGSPITGIFCKDTEMNCVAWNIDEGCLTYQVSPTESCRNAVEISGMIVMFLLLVGIYFVIGALIALKFGKK